MKRVFSIALAGAVLLLALTGFAWAGGTKEGAAGSPVTLSVFVKYNPSWPITPDTWIWKAIQDASKVKLDLILVSDASYTDKLTTTLASGDLPDLMEIQDVAIRNKYAQAGALLNFTKHMGEMPNFSKVYNASADNKILVKNFASSDGQLYGMPAIGAGDTGRQTWWYRADIFKANNLTAPKSYDEIYTVSKTLKAKYPDSYPLVGRWLTDSNMLNSTLLTLMTRQWSTGFPFYFDFTADQWKSGLYDASLKDFVAWFNKMYQEKLVPTDIATFATKELEQVMTTNRAFMAPEYLSRLMMFDGLLKANDPKVSIEFMAPPVGMTRGVAKFFNNCTIWDAMSASASSKKVADIIKFVDWQYTDQAEQLVSWGKEGETFKVVDGKRVWIKPAGHEADDQKKLYGLGTDGAGRLFDFTSNLTPDVDPNYAFGMIEGKKYEDPLYPFPSLNEQELATMSSQGDPFMIRANEGIINFITGKRPMAEWDKFVAEQKALGTDTFLKILNDTYQRSK